MCDGRIFTVTAVVTGDGLIGRLSQASSYRLLLGMDGGTFLSVIIGIDGGGTKTELFGLDVKTKRGFHLIGGPSNPNTVGFETTFQNVCKLVENSLNLHCRHDNEPISLAVCMAGIDRENGRASLLSALQAYFPSIRVQVGNDAQAVLAAGTQGEPGVALIAGTGSIAIGEDATGYYSRAGGYGPLIGDEGGGFFIGREAIMTAVQSFEGRAPATQLWSRVTSFFDINHPQELIPRIYESSHPISTIASFAIEVVQCAREGDVTAGRIIREAISHHIRLIESVAHRLDDRIERRLILSGGLFRSEWLVEQLNVSTPGWRLEGLTYNPAAGAALRAGKEMYKPDDIQSRCEWNEFLSIWKSVASSSESE